MYPKTRPTIYFEQDLMYPVNHMGQNYQDEKYALSVSLFVSFHSDLESKWAIGGSEKKYPVNKYNKESNGMALFLWQMGSI